MDFLAKCSHIRAFALASFSLVSVAGCSDDPATPGPVAGSPGVGGGGAGVAGAPAQGGTGMAGSGAAGSPMVTGGSGGGAAGAPVAGAPAAGAPAGGASAGTGGGSAGVPGGAGAPGPSGNKDAGKTAYASSGCTSCHGAMGEGLLGPNITGSKTAGIGNWTEAQFITGLREAKGPDGVPFCPQMVPVPATAVDDTKAKDIYAYLMSIVNDTPMKGFCD